jgi:hypothetical protein
MKCDRHVNIREEGHIVLIDEHECKNHFSGVWEDTGMLRKPVTGKKQ